MLPEVGSMTTLCPGTSFPSFSAASTMAFAILSLTEPPTERHSSLPTKRRVFMLPNSERDGGKYIRRLHLRPSSAAILSSRMRGVLPTASRALSRMWRELAMSMEDGG